MARKPRRSIGMEYDIQGIRAAELKRAEIESGHVTEIESLQEIRGDFREEKDLLKALREMRALLSIGNGDRLATCLIGKQVYAAQMPFKQLPDEELRSALRYEIRKSLPFDAANAIVEYQIIGELDAAAGTVPLLITATAPTLVQRHLDLLGKAGLRPAIIDILPTAVANVFWTSKPAAADAGAAHLMLHLSPTVCTLVFDGDQAAFFSRSIYFSAHDVFGTSNTEDRVRLADTLIDEIGRSIAFYKKAYKIGAIAALHALGEYVSIPEVLTMLKAGIGLPLQPCIDPQRYGYHGREPAGKFDVAIALAMRKE